MSRILKWLFLIPLLLLALVVLVYAGSCVYGNFIQSPAGAVDTPDINKAEYRVTIANTGNTLFTDNCEDNNNIVILRGYWELVGDKYQYRDRTLVLDEKIFGEISVNRRQK